MAEREEELKSLLMKVKEESEKCGLKHVKNKDHGLWSHHFTANRWGYSERLYFFLAPKSLWTVTAHHEIKILAPLKKSKDKPR